MAAKVNSLSQREPVRVRENATKIPGSGLILLNMRKIVRHLPPVWSRNGQSVRGLRYVSPRNGQSAYGLAVVCNRNHQSAHGLAVVCNRNHQSAHGLACVWNRNCQSACRLAVVFYCQAWSSYKLPAVASCNGQSTDKLTAARLLSCTFSPVPSAELQNNSIIERVGMGFRPAVRNRRRRGPVVRDQ